MKKWRQERKKQMGGKEKKIEPTCENILKKKEKTKPTAERNHGKGLRRRRHEDGINVWTLKRIAT
jgi:hypothetical protein